MLDRTRIKAHTFNCSSRSRDDHILEPGFNKQQDLYGMGEGRPCPSVCLSWVRGELWSHAVWTT